MKKISKITLGKKLKELNVLYYKIHRRGGFGRHLIYDLQAEYKKKKKEFLDAISN